MATLKETISLNDRVSPILGKIIKSLKSTVSAISQVDTVSKTAFNRATQHIAEAEAALKDLGNESKNAGNGMQQLGGKVAAMKNPLLTLSSLIYTLQQGWRAFSGMTNIADEFVLTNARLNLMNDGLQTTADLQDRIMESAQRSRAEYTATAASVAKLGILAKDAFGSSAEIVAFSELINKSFKVGGASAQEQSSGMYQLTQAMAAGKLQGDEFRSIMENAPMIGQAIAQYAGKSVGELKEMSSQGLITANMIKNALFNSAESIEAKFQTMPRTMTDVATSIKNNALENFQPVLEKINEIVNSERFNQMSESIGRALAGMVVTAMELLERLVGVFNWVQDNWELVKNAIIAGVGMLTTGYVVLKAAALAYAIAQGLINVSLLKMNIALIGCIALIGIAVFLWNQAGVVGKILAVIIGVLAVVLAVLTVAQLAFNKALYACPLVWIIAIVIAVIAIFAILIIWLINLWQTNIDFRFGILKIWNNILDFFDKVPLFFKRVGNGITNVFSNIKITVAEILESMVNKTIDIINTLIKALNVIPGVSIDTIGHVSFAAETKLAEEAKKQARDAKLAEAEVAVNAKIQARDDKLRADKAAAEQSLAEKRAKAEAEKSNNKGSTTNPNYGEYINGGTIDEIGKINDDVSITDEDIKLLKEVAATEFVNKFTTLRPQMSVTFGDVRESADVNKIAEILEMMVEESLASALA